MGYKFDSQTGIITADTSELQADVIAEYKSNFGEDFVVDKGSVGSVLVTAETIARSRGQINVATVANQINPDIAGGIFLDAIWALTNGQRRQATITTVTATITGVSGTLIPSGSVAETSDGDRFVSIEDATIPVGGTIDVKFQSEQKGSVPCPAGSLETIADGGVLGWETITNTDAGVVGLETQSDAEARADRKLTLAVGAKAIPTAITSGLYALADVKSLVFRENYKSTIETIDGVVMNPHSIYICVDGATDAEIAQTLYAYKTLGCGYNNGSGIAKEVTIYPDDTPLIPYVAKFDRPNEIAIKIKITVRAGNSTIDPTTDIKQAIINYANSSIRTDGFKVGTNVSPIEISANVAQATNYFVTDCQVTKQSVDVYARDTIEMEIWEKAITSESLIEVVLL